jgi:hypothetical protein
MRFHRRVEMEVKLLQRRGWEVPFPALAFCRARMEADERSQTPPV